jgi:hypothetical protein
MRSALLTSLVRAAALGLLVFLPGRGLAQSVAQHTPDHAVTSGHTPVQARDLHERHKLASAR